MKNVVVAFAALMGMSLGLPVLAEDLPAAALEGAWLVSVGEQARDRFLIVKGAKTEKDEVRVDSAVYGWIDGKGKQVGNWKAQVFGDAIKLSYVTGADSLVNVAFKSDETSVGGYMVTKAGKKYDVRMTRLEDEELAALRGAAAEEKSGKSKLVGAKKTSQISLVYVGADNCPSCAGYPSLMDNDGQRLKQSMPELAPARVVHVQLGYYVAAVPESMLPADLKWLLQPNAAGKKPLRKRGTPFFAAVVDHKVIAQGHGSGALQTLVAPAIKRAAEERRNAN